MRFASPLRIDSWISSNNLFGWAGRSGMTLSDAFWRYNNNTTINEFKFQFLSVEKMRFVNFFKKNNTFANFCFATNNSFWISSISRFIRWLFFFFVTFRGLCRIWKILLQDTRRCSLIYTEDKFEFQYKCYGMQKKCFNIYSKPCQFSAKVIKSSICYFFVIIAALWTSANNVFSFFIEPKFILQTKCRQWTEMTTQIFQLELKLVWLLTVWYKISFCSFLWISLEISWYLNQFE